MEDRVINRSSKRITNPYGNGHHGVDLGWSRNEEDNKIYANCKGVDCRRRSRDGTPRKESPCRSPHGHGDASL